MTKLRPIRDVADDLGLHQDHVLTYGRGKAKIDHAALARPARGEGKLVLVSAINPTPAGEGKTTTSVALAMGMKRLGVNVALCLREPSLGPVFGIKGGGTGGGKAQVVPADEINLHFTGDIHAIGSAHNLIAAIVDNELHFRGKSGLDPRRITWPRVMDMNDRALRSVTVGRGGWTGGVPRETRFDITAASEVMAVLCLASSKEDLRHRLARIVVGRTQDRTPVTVEDLGCADAAAALLQDAILPNLAQTSEGGPALVHGGPFANIAHGCSSVMATKVGMHQGDVVITEAGFGFDLGGEKFLDIKCRQTGIWPRTVVLVATLRALASHGGADPKAPGGSEMGALKRGLDHLDRQIKNVRAFGIEPVVALNVFDSDTDGGLSLVQSHCEKLGVPVGRSRGFLDGGAGAEHLSQVVLDAIAKTDEAPPRPKFLYELEASYHDKFRAVARTIYGADEVKLSAKAKKQLHRIETSGFGHLPVCMAKTHLSLSDDPKGGGMPVDFDVTVNSVRLSAGAGFVVALMGDIMTMPGLPRVPAAARVRIDADGSIRGLMQND